MTDEFEGGLESQVPLSGVVLDICIELVRDTSSMLTHESLFNATLLIFGNFTEEAIANCLDVRNFVAGNLPELGNDKVIAMKLEELVEECVRDYSGRWDQPNLTLVLRLDFVVRAFL